MRTDRRRTLILLVEDDLGDQELLRRAAEDRALKSALQIVSSGVEALDYLLRRHDYRDARDAPRPDLVLLDVNMPGLDGKAVLAALADHPELRRIPVVMLTTSNAAADIEGSYALGCNSFITKPIDVDDFVDTLHFLELYWFELVTLPPR